MTRLASRTFKRRVLSAQSARRKRWQGTGGHGLSCYRTHLSDGGSIPQRNQEGVVAPLNRK